MNTKTKILVVVLSVLIVLFTTLSIAKYLKNKNKQDKNVNLYTENQNNNEENSSNEDSEKNKFSKYYVDDIGYVKTSQVKEKLEKVDPQTISFMVLITLGSYESGKYNFYDMDRFNLYTLFVNTYIDESYYDEYSEDTVEVLAYINATKFEKKFTEVTGIDNVENFFSDYVRGTEISSKDIIVKDKETLKYVFPIGGRGFEDNVMFFTDVSEKDGHLIITIENYLFNRDKNKYNLEGTFLFEISKESLRIYGWEVK